MKSVGEAMAIGRTFKESFQKAMRSLEIGLKGFESGKLARTGAGQIRYSCWGQKTFRRASSMYLYKAFEDMGSLTQGGYLRSNPGLIPGLVKQLEADSMLIGQDLSRTSVWI